MQFFHIWTGYIETRLEYQMYNAQAIENMAQRIMTDVTHWEHTRSVLWLDPFVAKNLPPNVQPVFADLEHKHIGIRLPLHLYTDIDSHRHLMINPQVRITDQVFMTVLSQATQADWLKSLSLEALATYLERDNFIRGG